ncbi:PIN domain-like protein [Lipomyces japonicus]|uniref:PIN domain-like protein n=1 Tax=Lipomyces japonicus TaxID=56871 RepID=UPI0034CD436A
MGVPGLWPELNKHEVAENKSMASLAREFLERVGRPIRLAVDGNLWGFHNKGGKGGYNPDKRTFYYRLCKMMNLGICAIFVYDGPQKPSFKRNKVISPIQPAEVRWMIDLIEKLGFQTRIAPGEAEAECAYLQKMGAVDYVVSDDVDVFIFGATKVITNWNREKRKANKSASEKSTSASTIPVQIYKMDTVKEKTGLDIPGMVLIALMSGGDYDTKGVLKCGSHVSIEAAKAGYGAKLIGCGYNRDKTEDWKQQLIEALHSNSKKEFTTRHKALKLEAEFPDEQVVRNYLDPIVSNSTVIDWNGKVDINGLYEFVHAELKHGSYRFIRYLAPSILIQQIANGDGSNVIAVHDSKIRVQSDGIELRISYVPSQVIEIELPNDDSDSSSQTDETVGSSMTDTKSSKRSNDEPARIWILEPIARMPLKDKISEWQKRQAAKAVKKKRVPAQENTILSYLKPIKPHGTNTSTRRLQYDHISQVSKGEENKHSKSDKPRRLSPINLINSNVSSSPPLSSKSNNEIIDLASSSPLAADSIGSHVRVLMPASKQSSINSQYDYVELSD